MKQKILSLLSVLLIAALLCSCGGSGDVGKGGTLYAGRGVYYEMFVRSFADSDGDGIGDLQGAISKLDYLNDGNPDTDTDLGVTGIWLMPVFASNSYHGYDVTDYYTVNPDYGTNDDLKQFLEECHRRGITVIMDFMLNHTSSDHPWFIDSQTPGSEYRSWYRWVEEGDDSVDLQAVEMGNTVWHEKNRAYYAAVFWEGMPDLNYDEPAVREEMKKVAKFWLDLGVDGYRFDAVPHIYDRGEVAISEADSVTEKNYVFWQEMIDYCRSIKPECYVVGEVWYDSEIRADYVPQVGSVFHFNMVDNIASAIKNQSVEELTEAIKEDLELLKEKNENYIDAVFLTNHDMNRVGSLMNGNTEQLKQAAAMYLTMEGIPFIYYGEELGMEGKKPDEQLRTPFLWGAGDSALTTWQTSKYNGEVASQPEQAEDGDSLLSFYRRLIRLRTGNDAFLSGRATILESGTDTVAAWEMASEQQRLVVAHNVGSSTENITVPEGGSILFQTGEGAEFSGTSLSIPSKASVVIEMQ